MTIEPESIKAVHLIFPNKTRVSFDFPTNSHLGLGLFTTSSCPAEEVTGGLKNSHPTHFCNLLRCVLVPYTCDSSGSEPLVYTRIQCAPSFYTSHTLAPPDSELQVCFGSAEMSAHVGFSFPIAPSFSAANPGVDLI